MSRWNNAPAILSGIDGQAIARDHSGTELPVARIAHDGVVKAQILCAARADG
jgi:hypothetical protein